MTLEQLKDSLADVTAVNEPQSLVIDTATNPCSLIGDVFGSVVDGVSIDDVAIALVGQTWRTTLTVTLKTARPPTPAEPEEALTP